MAWNLSCQLHILSAVLFSYLIGSVGGLIKDFIEAVLGTICCCGARLTSLRVLPFAPLRKKERGVDGKSDGLSKPYCGFVISGGRKMKPIAFHCILAGSLMESSQVHLSNTSWKRKYCVFIGHFYSELTSKGLPSRYPFRKPFTTL